jgi:hypothetical protein
MKAFPGRIEVQTAEKKEKDEECDGKVLESMHEK